MCDCRIKTAFRLEMVGVDGQWVREGTKPIHYCRCCARLVPSSDLAANRTSLNAGQTLCKLCQPRSLRVRFHARYSFARTQRVALRA